MGIINKRIKNEPMTEDDIERILRTKFLLSEADLNRVSQNVLVALKHVQEEEMVLKDSIGKVMIYISILFLTSSIGYFLYEGVKDRRGSLLSSSLNLDLSSSLPYLITLFIFVVLCFIGLIISVNKERSSKFFV